MLLQDSWEEFGTKVLEGVAARQGIDKFPVKAEIFENIIVDTLDEMEISCDWDPGSHRQGADIDLPLEDLFLSVKSAQVKGMKKQVMSISSFRTTAYDSLHEKLNFIDGGGKNFTHYLVLAREDKKKKKVFVERKYTALLVPANQFLAKNMTWEESTSGWKSLEKYDDELGYAMNIHKKMSDQLWIYCDYKKVKADPNVKILFSVTIPAENLGNTHKIVRRAA